MVFGFNGLKVTPEIKTLIEEYHLGSIILFGRNIGTPKEVLALTNELQQIAKDAGHERPLLICTDQENGAVRRLGEGATVFPGAMLLGATHDAENARKVGEASGSELKSLGINWNLSPVLDVNNNAENPVIGVRSFGENPDNVTEMGRSLMQGMQAAGLMTTLKHFPGHGDTHVDSHLDLPRIEHGIERLEEIELKPFKECIEAGADTVMTAHIVFPAIEKREGVPATLSKAVVTGLLRKKLGFEGVVTTDCMEMNAVADTFGTPQGAVEALNAGVDLVMVSHTYPTQRDTLERVIEAAEAGEITEEVLDAALERVANLKDRYLSWDDLSLENAKVPESVGSVEHKELAKRVYEQGVTMVRSGNALLPLSTEEKVLLVYPENNSTMVVEDKRYSTFSLGESMKELSTNVEVLEVSNPPTKEELARATAKAASVDKVVLATLTAVSSPGQIELAEEIYKANQKLAIIATRSPYDLAYLPDIPVYLCTYEFTTPALQTAAEALFGKTQIKGKLPVTIPEKVQQA